MAPTETAILTHYLTIAAKLPTIVTLEQFTTYFPKAQQSHPQIRSLYRQLQHERNATVDAVLANIAHEEKRAKAMRREAARARREATDAEPDAELELERALFGSADGRAPRHDLSTLIPEMDSALTSIEADIRSLEAEEAALRDTVQQTVGGLSDLRYGRLSNQRLPDEVIQGLKTLQAQCDAKT